MSAMRPGLPDPLIALLGARWAMGAPVVGAAWFDQNSVGFALADGSVATAPARWQGAARVQARPAGGVELVPADQAPPPVARATVHTGAGNAIIADASGRLLSGGADGIFAAISPNGEVEVLGRFAGTTVNVVAAASNGARACAAGSTVHRLGADPGEIDLRQPVLALAFDANGRHLAIGLRDRVVVWTGGETRNLAFAGTHAALAWSPDAQHLVSGMAEGRAHAWRWLDGADITLGDTPAAPLSLSFSVAGRLVASSGGPQILCWHLGVPEARREECGVASTAGVTRVACHPWRTLIAAGYENGAVLLCQPNSRDVLFVRAAGGGAVTALTWSADGSCLAVGTAGGEIGLVAFPELLFRPMPGQMQEAS